jgi:hypothetical protein
MDRCVHAAHRGSARRAELPELNISAGVASSVPARRSGRRAFRRRQRDCLTDSSSIEPCRRVRNSNSLEPLATEIRAPRHDAAGESQPAPATLLLDHLETGRGLPREKEPARIVFGREKVVVLAWMHNAERLLKEAESALHRTSTRVAPAKICGKLI